MDEERTLTVREFTVTTTRDGAHVASIAGRVSDHHDPAAQKEYIAFQFEIEQPVNWNGAALLRDVLSKAQDQLGKLVRAYALLSNQASR